MVFNAQFLIQIFGFIALITGVYALLYLAIKRQNYGRIIPSLKTRFIDVLGNMSFFNFNVNSYNGYTALEVFVNYGLGFFKLFPNNADVLLAYLTYLPVVVIVSPEAVEEMMKSTVDIQKAWFYNWLHCWLRTGLLTSYGQKWKSRRKLLTPAFHFDILKDFMPIIHEKSVKLIDKLQKDTNKEYTDISIPISLCSLDIICETTLGIDINAQGNSESEYVKAVNRVTDNLMKRILSFWSWIDFTFFLTHAGRQTKKDIKLMGDFTLSVIKEKKMQLMKGTGKNDHKSSKRKPLMEVLLEHHLKTKDLTEEDIREEVETFTFEGHDTTATVLTWTLYLLGLHKEIQEKIQEELLLIFGNDTERPVTMEDLKDMHYIEQVIKESMRLYPPVTLMARQVNRDDATICGYPIMKGTAIAVLPLLLHRNEKIYPNPEVFDPERFTPENSANRHPFAYIPFSAGPRNCIGQKLAMMEVKTLLANILRNFSLTSLDPRDKLLPSAKIILRPSGPVRVKIRPKAIDSER